MNKNALETTSETNINAIQKAKKTNLTVPNTNHYKLKNIRLKQE